MGGSDPNVIKELQQADQNPFPERHFDGKSDDPLENLKNQVRQLRIYSAHRVANHVTALCDAVPAVAGDRFSSAVQVQLSCYGDAVGGNLKALKSFLDNKVSGKHSKRILAL